MSAPVIDAHAHTSSRQFDDDRDAMYQRAWDAGLVAHRRGRRGRREQSAGARAARGRSRAFTPSPACTRTRRSDLDAQREELAALRRLAATSPASARSASTSSTTTRRREAQFEAFQWQLELAREAQLPVVIHCREADEDGFAILNEWAGRVGRYLGPEREIGMLHCFSGDADLATRYIEIGFLISIPGPVTYKNNDRGQEVARTIPLAAMLVETDAPYLTPTPHRGKRNEPAYVVETARFVAALRGMRLRRCRRDDGTQRRAVVRVHAMTGTR